LRFLPVAQHLEPLQNILQGDRVIMAVARDLTRKQQKFVTELQRPENRSYSDAYRASYDCDAMSPKAIRNEASKLRHHPGVTMALDAARERIEVEKRRDGVAERRAIRNRLWSEVDDPDTPAAARIQALRLLGLASGTGMFSETQRVEVSEPMPASEAEVIAEIEDLLRREDETGPGG
jgi:hypothetical protein